MPHAQRSAVPAAGNGRTAGTPCRKPASPAREPMAASTVTAAPRTRPGRRLNIAAPPARCPATAAVWTPACRWRKSGTAAHANATAHAAADRPWFKAKTACASALNASPDSACKTREPANAPALTAWISAVMSASTSRSIGSIAGPAESSAGPRRNAALGSACPPMKTQIAGDASTIAPP